MWNSSVAILWYMAGTVKSFTFAILTGERHHFFVCDDLLTQIRFITTPLLLMDLLLTAAMPWPTLLFVILVDEGKSLAYNPYQEIVTTMTTSST